MGADLYRKGFEENAEKEHPAFEQACKARGEHQAQHQCVLNIGGPSDCPEISKLQDEVNAAWDRVHPEHLYFRDSYNGSSVLWTLGISWWKDAPQGDEEGNVQPQDLLAFAQRIEDAQYTRPKLESDERPEEVDEYFTKKKARLVKFLRDAGNARPHVSQRARGERPGQHPGQIQNGNSA